MKNKLILFDWGNIVESHTTGYTCYDAWNDMFRECGYVGDENILPHLYKYRICCINSYDEFKQVYEKLCLKYKLNKTYKEFVNIYQRIFDKIDYYKNVSDFEKSLKEKCYIGILSNLTMFDKERLDKEVDLSQYDYVFLSYEMQMEKPNIEIYNKVQSELPFEPKNILFIDDSKANIETASKIGWNTFQITGLELNKIKQKCENFLKEEN